MAEKHVIKFHFIAKFFGNSTRHLARGENSYTSGHVEKFTFIGSVRPIIMKGLVKASMKKRSYAVEISYDLQKGITSASCTCPRGSVSCSHMAALLYYAHYHISTTDIECQWSIPHSVPSKDNITKLKDLFPMKTTYTASQRKSSEEEIYKFRSNLGTSNVVGFSWLLRPEPSQEASICIPDIEAFVNSREYIESTNGNDFLQQKCALTTDNIKYIEKITQGQHSNANWYIARKHRLTASKFGTVLSACRRNKFPPSLFKSLTEGYSLAKVSAVQWGKENETTALEEFKCFTKLEVQASGLWLDCSGFLGASPDGLINDDYVLEIKCPFKYRHVNSLKDAISDKSYFYWYDENNSIVLNTEHNYYHQVQGQMYLTGRSMCYFVVWTPQCLDILTIEKCPDWAENINTLKTFYVSKYLPFISK